MDSKTGAHPTTTLPSFGDHPFPHTEAGKALFVYPHSGLPLLRMVRGFGCWGPGYSRQ